jgi:hypothetical protein
MQLSPPNDDEAHLRAERRCRSSSRRVVNVCHSSTGWMDCNFDRGGMIAQVDRADIEDQAVGPRDGSSWEAANAVAHVDAGSDAFAAEPR